jgi:hypothetical protein
MANPTDPQGTTDWFTQQIAGVNQQGQQQGMPQVATAPDGVPVYGSGGQYFTRNADGSMTQQFQGGAPDWLTQQTGGGQQGGGPPTLNRNDPASVQAYISYYSNQPGANPSLKNDPGYWAGKISSGELGNDPNYIVSKFMLPEGAGAGGGTLGNPGNYQAPAPFTGQTNYTPQTITQPAAVTASQVSPQGIAQPGSITPQTVQGPQALQARTLADPAGFKAPTMADVQNDPNFQYAQQQAMQSLVNSGAAKGIARGSNEWKALQEQAASLAGQQYEQMYQNSLNAYQTNTGNTLAYNQANNANLAQAYGLTNQYQQAAGMFNAGQNYNAQAQNIGNTMQANQFNAGQNLQGQLANQGANLQAGQFNAGMNYNTQNANQANQFAASQANNQNALAAYQTNANTALGAYGANVQAGLGYGNLALNQQGQNYNQGLSTFNANQGANQQLFNNNYSLAQLGLAANGQMGQAGQNYGNQATNAYEGIGNAQAAGSMNQGANWGGALGNAANYGTQLWALGQLGQQPQQNQASSYAVPPNYAG